MTNTGDRQREADHICGQLAGEFENSVWDCRRGLLYGFESEDPALTGRPEDGDDGFGVFIVNKQTGERFQVQIEVFVHPLPSLEEDPVRLANLRLRVGS